MTDQEQIDQTKQEDELEERSIADLDMSFERKLDKNVKVVLISAPEKAEYA